MNLELFPTLQIQREFFARPRAIARFWEYLGILSDGDDIVTPITSLNPMGREHNAAKVEELLALEAETVAAQALTEAEQRLPGTPGVGPFKFSLVVSDDLGGMWSNRTTSELSQRVPGQKLDNALRRGFIEIACWVSQRWTPELIRQEVLMMAYRLTYWQLRERPRTLGEVMTQEGLAMRFAGLPPTLPADDLEYSRHVLAPHRAATETSILMPALFGDPAAREFGYEPLGLSPRAGLEVALAEALASTQTPEGAFG
jgi:hypothetical protein